MITCSFYIFFTFIPSTWDSMNLFDRICFTFPVFLLIICGIGCPVSRTSTGFSAYAGFTVSAGLTVTASFTVDACPTPNLFFVASFVGLVFLVVVTVIAGVMFVRVDGDAGEGGMEGLYSSKELSTLSLSWLPPGCPNLDFGLSLPSW